MSPKSDSGSIGRSPKSSPARSPALKKLTTRKFTDFLKEDEKTQYEQYKKNTSKGDEKKKWTLFGMFSKKTDK